MNIIDSRLGEPIMSRFPWKTCLITDSKGEEFPGYITRGSKSENGQYEYFEASRVFPYEYRGKEVLVDVESAGQPFRVYSWSNKRNAYKTDKGRKNPETGKREGVFTAVITMDPRPVYTLVAFSAPEELLKNMSPEQRAAFKTLEAEDAERFIGHPAFSAQMIDNTYDHSKEH